MRTSSPTSHLPAYDVTRGSNLIYKVLLGVEEDEDTVRIATYDALSGEALPRNRRTVPKSKADKVRKRGDKGFAHWCLRQVWLEPVT